MRIWPRVATGPNSTKDTAVQTCLYNKITWQSKAQITDQSITTQCKAHPSHSSSSSFTRLGTRWSASKCQDLHNYHKFWFRWMINQTWPKTTRNSNILLSMAIHTQPASKSASLRITTTPMLSSTDKADSNPKNSSQRIVNRNQCCNHWTYPSNNSNSRNLWTLTYSLKPPRTSTPTTSLFTMWFGRQPHPSKDLI